MEIFNEKHLETLSRAQQQPCFSLYMPTHRTHPANAQDSQRFRTLVTEFDAVREQYKKDAPVQAVFAKFDELADDYFFWQHTLEGLAVFATPASFYTYLLNRPVEPLAMVADRFHTMPLQKHLQSADRFHVLVLSANDAKLYEGNRYQLDELILAGNDDIPATMIDALDHELRDLHATLASYRTATGEKWDGPQNHGLKKTALNNDVEQFFRAIDRGILTYYSKPSGLPLILAALPAHHHLFRRVSQNKQLIDEGIQMNASALTKDELRKLAWEIFEPYYESRVDDLIQTFRQVSAHRLGVDQIDQIVKDTYDGKVDTLLLEENYSLPGKIVDRDQIEYGNGRETPYQHDILDDLSELVKNHGGEVFIIPSRKMPSETGAAAINRF